MNSFDVTLMILLGALVLIGLWKGLTRLLIGIGALIAAFVLAAQLHQSLAVDMRWMNAPDPVLKLIAFLVIFLGTMLAGGLIAYLTRKLVRAAMLSWADRLAGAALGLVAGMLIASLLILPMLAYSGSGEQTLRDSVLAPYVTAVADLTGRWVPRELSELYRERVEGLRDYWRERWANRAEPDPSQV